MTSPRSDALHLLTTKLHPPRFAGRIVPRPRLLDRLAEGAGRRLTLVSAPPGYGKTTLVSDWLQQSGAPYAWLSLDERDADIVTFASYLVGAIRTVYPDSLSMISSVLGAASVSDPLRLADILLSDLEGLAGPVILALDDFHSVQNQPVLAFLGRILQHLPADVRLIVITRSDPPLPLAQLRGRQQLAEIRTSDLRFSNVETQALVEGVAGQALPDEITTLLAERTEGWPVGLQLASLSLRESDDPSELVCAFASANDRLVAEYLVSEVLERLPERQRRLLMRLSALDRICGALCEAIAENDISPGAGDATLAAVWRSNLFLVALDAEGRWYRFHSLFLELLRRELSRLYTDEEIASMKLQASAWCEAQGLIEEAIAYAVQARADRRAADLVDAHLHEALNREDVRLLERWITALPDSVLSWPGILTARAFLQHFRFRSAAMISLVEAARTQLERDTCNYAPADVQNWRGAIDTLRAVASSVNGTAEDCIAYASLALQQLPEQMSFARSLAEYHNLVALQRIGRRKEAIAVAQTDLARHTGAPDSRTLRLTLALCGIHHAEADVQALEIVATSYRQLAQEHGFLISLGWANACLGWVHYQRNELASAEEYFRQVSEDRLTVHGRCALDGLAGLTLTLRALGRDQDAQVAVSSLRQMLHDRDMVELMPFADGLAVFLDPDSGNSAALGSLAHNPKSQIARGLWVLPVLVAVRIHIRQGAPERLEAASALLQQCRSAAESRRSIRQWIEIGALEALLHRARGNEAAALASLREAVLLGEPGGALRLVADAGPGLAPLLRQLQSEGVAPAYVARILSVLTQSVPSSPQARLLLPAPAEGARQGTRALDDLLTNRELDVLLLLERRLTNKEIASHLGVTPDTIKKHAHSVFRKLGSENRRQAVARARELGILPPSPSAP